MMINIRKNLLEINIIIMNLLLLLLIDMIKMKKRRDIKMIEINIKINIIMNLLLLLHIDMIKMKKRRNIKMMIKLKKESNGKRAENSNDLKKRDKT